MSFVDNPTSESETELKGEESAEGGFGGGESDGEPSDDVDKGKKHCLDYLICVCN